MTSYAGTSRPRFGIWAASYGYQGVQNHPDEPLDSSYQRTRALACSAQEWGYDAILFAQHVMHPSLEYGDVLETWTGAAAIAEATNDLEVIAAVKSFLFNPGVLAKLALGIDQISGGRFAINIISGWFQPEFTQLGIPMLPHDERYEYSAEWLSVIRRLWDEETVTHRGRHFCIEGLRLAPGPVTGRAPTVYLGGLSEPALDLAVRQADVFLINGRPFDEVKELIEDLRARPRPAGMAPLRFGLVPFIIVRQTDEEAEEEFEHLLELKEHDDDSFIDKGVDPRTVLFEVNDRERKVGLNGGTLAGLVGSYDTVVDRIAQFHEAGVETFLAQFQPLEREVARFGRNVIPRFRRD